MNVQERVLATIGDGRVSARELYAKIALEHPSVLDCALAALMRAGLLELTGGEYRRPGAPRKRPQRYPVPQRGNSPRPLMYCRDEREIRADLRVQLDDILARWKERLRNDRGIL